MRVVTSYNNSTLLDLVADIKAACRNTSASPRAARYPGEIHRRGYKDSLRGPVKKRMQAKGLECHCIRCREYGHRIAEGWKSVSPC